MEARISINQLADFSKATGNRKKKIIEIQKTPNPLLTPWCWQAKAGMKKYFEDVTDISPILKTIELIKIRPDHGKENNKRDKVASVRALTKFLEINPPARLRNLNYSLIKPTDRSMNIRGVRLILAPEVIIKFKIGNKIHYGGIKFHFSKDKPFKNEQSALITTMIYEYLNSKIAKEGEIVVPEFCFCLDLFGRGYNQAPTLRKKYVDQVKGLCDEVRNIWDTIE